MDELGDALHFGVAGEPLLEEILDRLDVVVGARLDRLHARGVGFRKLGDERIELAEVAAEKAGTSAMAGLPRAPSAIRLRRARAGGSARIR